jgi:hypothetical protein
VEAEALRGGRRDVNDHAALSPTSITKDFAQTEHPEIVGALRRMQALSAFAIYSRIVDFQLLYILES